MLLTTKLFVPSLPGQRILRARLHERLDAALSARLTLVSAPPGFGKSTLLAEWVQRCAARRPAGAAPGCAWLSLDEQDNDPLRFYTHFLSALRQADRTLGGDLLTLQQSPHLPSGETLMSALINDTANRTAPLILVLDDYHVIDNGELHRALIFLIDNAPACLHLVIATRANPPFPLARWRVRRSLLEVREEDLRFDRGEVAAFLAQTVTSRLSDEEIAAIERRTEGWIGALQLASLSMQGTGDQGGFLRRLSGSHTYIFDYLVEEVLNRQPAAIQHFLLQTSCLERMCGELCAAVSGNADSEAILHALHQQNLFTFALDNERRWFRYHHLFREMLRARLRRLAPEGSTGILLAASEWCAANGLLPEALHYALAAPDPAQAADLIERHYWEMLERSEYVQLRNWLKCLPPDLIRARPLLSLAKAWSLYATYRLPAIGDCLQDAERALAAGHAAGSGAHAEESRLRAEIITLQASNAMYAGDSRRAIALAQQALEIDADRQPLIFCTNTIALAYSYNLLGEPRRACEWARLGCARGAEARLPFPAAENQEIVLFYLERIGAFEEGEAIIRRVLAAATDGDALAVFLSTSAHLFLGRYLLERYELEQAAGHMTIAQQQATRLGLEYPLIKCHIQLMYVRQAQGRWPEAYAHLLKMWELSSSFSDYYLQLHAAFAAHGCLLQGEVAKAADFMAKAGVAPEDAVTPGNEPEVWILAWLLYAQGRLDAALDLADRVRAVHAATGRVRREMEMWCLRALVLWQQLRTAEALAALDPALAIGQRCRLLYSLVTMPKLLGALLRTYSAQDAGAPYAGFARQLLALTNSHSSLPQPVMPEQISSREREVLGLVAEGLSDRQIAERLIVAPGTVKRHLNNLYGKLGVHSRTGALARARELALL